MITPRLKKQFRLFRVAEATWWKRVPRVMFLQLCELYFFLFFTPFPSYSCSFPFMFFSLFSVRLLLWYVVLLLSLSFDSSFDGSRNQSQIWWFSHFGDGHQSMNGYLYTYDQDSHYFLLWNGWPWDMYHVLTMAHVCMYIYIYIYIVH